jgi:hypothetical protein
MNRRHAAHLVGVVAVAVAVRLALYPHIAIRGDLGYWLLDSRWVADGMRPFVDFIGRSPLFLYAYAGAIEVVGASLASFRWFVASLWLAVGLVAYGTARVAATHRAGLVALGAATLTPYPVAFAFFSSSQSLGVLLVAVAVLALVDRDTPRRYALAGALVGLAFLSRRSLVLALPAIATWLAVAGLTGRPWRRVTASGVLTGAGFGVALAAGYLALALGNLQTAWELFVIHFVNLFVSTGSGGVPLLEMSDAVLSGETATSSSSAPLATLLDYRSQLALVATVIAGLPALLVVWDPIRAACTRWLRPRDVTLLRTAAVAVAGLAAAQAALGGLWYRLVWLGAAVLVVVALHERDRLAAARLASPAVAIPLLVAGWVGLGYVIRPNLLAAYYAMDVVPFLAVPLGIAVDQWWPSLDARDRRVAATAVVVVCLVGATPLAPLGPGLSLNSDGQHNRVQFFNVDNVQQINEDVERIAGENGTVLTNQPNYAATNDVHVFERNTRAVYLRHLFGDSGPMLEYYGRLTRALRAGEIDVVVHERFNRIMIETNATANRTLHDCYEPVGAGPTYDALNTTLMTYDGCR